MNDYSKEQIQKVKQIVIKGQVNRFHDTYKSYFEKEETLALVTFFFDKVYNTEAKSEWVDLAVTSFDKIKNIMKDETRQSMEKLLELNSLTDELDSKMAISLLDRGWKKDSLSKEEFLTEFIGMGQAADRYRQLEIVLLNLMQFYELAHRPINAILIKPAKFMSKILGFASLFSAIEEGYNACLPVNRELFNSFYAEVKKTEYEFLAKCFPDYKL